MTTQSIVSVIVTVFNEKANIRDLINGISGQTRLPDEVVIVDGGSSDGTYEYLKEISSINPLFCILQEFGCNIATGRNRAAAIAKGNVFVVTDAGCRPEPDWLEKLIQPLEHDESVDAVGGRVVSEPRSRLEFFAGLLSLPDPESDGQRGMFYGRSSAFRRALWERVNGYPDWLYTAEDTLFALRALELGFRAVYAPESVVHWRPRTSLSKLAKMFYLYGRGEGRIGHGSLSGIAYWLKFYILIILLIMAGWFAPWFFWSLGLIVMIYLMAILVYPNLVSVRDKVRTMDAFWYVPLIVITRNISSNLGYLRGYLEYRFNPLFRERLARYMMS